MTEQNAQLQPEPAAEPAPAAPSIPLLRVPEQGVQAYDLPVVDAELTPAEAAEQLNVIMAEAASDKLHPYGNKNHIQHPAYKDAVRKLFEKKAEASDGLSPTTRACNEAMAGLAAKQDKLVEAGKKQLAACQKAGIGRGDIPADLKNYDLKEYHLTIWRMQELHAEDKFEELTPMFEKQVQLLKPPPKAAAAFAAFSQADDMDVELRSHIAEGIIKYIHDANKHIYGGK